MIQLKDPSLFRSQCFVNNAWVDAESKKTISVNNPATNEEIGTVPQFVEADTKKAIDAAWNAWKGWSDMRPAERAKILNAWNDEIQKNKEDLALILSYEQGKPVAESLGEIALGASYIPWYGEEAKRAYGDVIPAPRKGVRPITHRTSVGPVMAITPWNFPSSMITRKAAPALAAGCPIIIKPASATPYSALALAVLAERAGFPAGVVNIITGSARAISAEVSANEKIRKLSFTGSTEVGKDLMAACSKTMKRVSLELGGNAPFIVFDDATLDTAINCLMGAKFRNAGQTCISANRIFVQKGIMSAFLEKITARVSALKIGSCTEEGSEVGPLIDMAAVEACEALLKDAVAKGAKITLGGKRHAKGLSYFEPTIITGVTAQMDIFNEEIFGPIASIIEFETEEEVIKLANQTPFGLASYVMTNDLGKSWRVPEGLEYGLCGVNDAALAMAEVPFGGVKESGTGKEGGHEGLDDFLETRYVLLGGI